MSVDKIPNMGVHSASNAKIGGGIKGGRGAQSSGDANDQEVAFGALLSSLGVGEAESTAATTTLPEASVDQPRGDVSSDGTAFMPCTLMIQVAPLLETPTNVDDIAKGGVQNPLLATVDTSVADGVGLIAADAFSSVVLPGTKQGVRSPTQSDLSQMPEAIGPGNVGIRAARLTNERGRTEGTSAVTTVPIQSTDAVDISRLDMRVVSEKAEFFGRAIGPTAAYVLQLDVGQQTEFRREKAIFKVNSATAGADLSAANGLDTKPANLSLVGVPPDVSSGMTQSDQNPRTYWMSSDMKNAEMKLDGFGETPVEVSISVHGNLTHVAFRTDEVQTRLALEDTENTLKDMLSKEGLNLAGLSVGASGTGGQGAQDRRSRQESRPALLGNLVSTFPSETSGHVLTSRVGQLDVFV